MFMATRALKLAKWNVIFGGGGGGGGGGDTSTSAGMATNGA
ncbi:unnamed protein product [Hydatigera taeniaeformis]|uniref:Uncharacterized protein n=1 Tax=Hydatigena taeniaeformis TaxID=6205 RepID=A0A0R3XA56_HYDTA|nr:unnamed protein product [Hydatigera taeniaeformis]